MIQSHEAFLARGAGLRQDAGRCRQLWSTVLLNAMNDAAREVKNAREDNNHGKADREIAIFKRWIMSRDGRTVMERAGVDPNDRAIAKAIEAVSSGNGVTMQGTRP